MNQSYYEPGQHVFTASDGITYKCVVVAAHADGSYDLVSLDPQPGAVKMTRSTLRLSDKRHIGPFTVDDRAVSLARGMWSEIAADCDWYNRNAKARRRLNDDAIDGTDCPVCGNDYRYGNHAPVYDFNLHDAGEETYHCQYPQEIDF